MSSNAVILCLVVVLLTGFCGPLIARATETNVTIKAKASSTGPTSSSASYQSGKSKVFVSARVSPAVEAQVPSPSTVHLPSPSPAYVPSPSPVHVEMKPAFPVDFSTVESTLRTLIFQRDVITASKVLGSSRVISLGAGLTFPPELAPLVDPSADRNQDPDVIAFRALAKSALETCDADKLATAVVLSFRPDCTCGVLSSEELDTVREGFVKDFQDKDELIRILKSDANEDDPATGRRLLQAGKSPVSSFVCSNCWPRRQCRKMRWCSR